MDELPGPSHREGTPPRRTRCRARMRDPEALQVGPGAVARLRSPILIKTSISFPSPGSAVYYLLWAGNSLRVLTIVKGLRRGGRGAEPDVLANAVRALCFIKTISLPFPGSGVSYLPPEGGWTSFRVRPIVRELPSPCVQERDL